MLRVTYRSNNSGGGWWLTTADWKALEERGWSVKWRRWLGSDAGEASKDFESLVDAVREWEGITKQDAADEGCNCCGPPHSFSAKNEKGEVEDHCSGDGVVQLLYPGTPETLREAAKRLSERAKQ